MGSDQTFRRYDAENIISIHAPRMGSDLFKIDKKENNDKISIHAPRMGSDAGETVQAAAFALFQSTLPGWGATRLAQCVRLIILGFQSTLPGWGATAKMDIFAHDMGKIIHFQH